VTDRGPELLDKASLRVLRDAVDRLEGGFGSLPAAGVDGIGAEGEAILLETADRLRDNYPYFHPFYAGQMLKPPHPLARTAYALAMWINPNNHALDGGRASSKMEREAVAALAGMFGWDAHLGHLTGGGTMANLEALWICGRLAPGKAIVASEQAHYTHSRICAVLGIPFRAVACDARGRMDAAALAREVARADVGTVVATMGTTACGAIDPLREILRLRERSAFRVHADAAYGGYFRLAGNLEADASAEFSVIAQADSIVVDPHKHGLQPYGCGAVLFRDPSVGRFYKHDSPYTYFSSGDLHLGEISLECSRAGASAVALWATQRLLPLEPGGAFAAGLESCREAARELHRRLSADARFVTAMPPELDIVVWAPAAASISASSAASRRIFEDAARRGLHLALAELPAAFFAFGPGVVHDKESVTALRSVLMKPEHLPWLERIWEVLDAAATGL
jgi:glutamate/tyrosine decarboxylase-like PLP-dependent enzyme